MLRRRRRASSTPPPSSAASPSSTPTGRPRRRQGDPLRASRAPGPRGRRRGCRRAGRGDDGTLVVVGRLPRRPRRDARQPRDAAADRRPGRAAARLARRLLGAGAALRPVEAMRERAAEISAASPGERLPVPGATTSSGGSATTLNEMLGRLETAIERERRFVDDASHELRTPLALTGPSSSSRCARATTGDLRSRSPRDRGGRPPDPARRGAARRRALGRGRLALPSRRTLVGGPVHDGRERFRAPRDRRPRARVEAGRPRRRGDRLRLEQALTSMVDNALRHGGGRGAAAAPRRATARSHSTCPTRARGSRTASSRDAFERFSRADAARGRGAPASASRSSTRSPGARRSAGAQSSRRRRRRWIELRANSSS